MKLYYQIYRVMMGKFKGFAREAFASQSLLCFSPINLELENIKKLALSNAYYIKIVVCIGPYNKRYRIYKEVEYRRYRGLYLIPIYNKKFF